MNPARLRSIREAGQWTVRGFARLADRSHSSFHEMEAGVRPIPDNVASWAEAIREAMRPIKPPEKTR